MKNTITFLISLFFLVNLYSQGVLLKPFGTSYQETITHLQSSEIGHLSSIGNDQLVVTTDHYEVLHHFRGGLLYKTEIVHFYKEKTRIREAMLSLRSNYELMQGEILDLNTGKDESAYVVKLKDELHEVSQIRLGKQGFQIVQVSLDLNACSHEEYSALQEDRNLVALLRK